MVANVSDTTRGIVESDIFADVIDRARNMSELNQQRIMTLTTSPAPGFNSNASVIFKPLEIYRQDDLGSWAVPAIHLNCSRFFYDGMCIVDDFSCRVAGMRSG